MADTATPGPAIAATRAILAGDSAALRMIAASISDYDFRESCTALLHQIVTSCEWGADEIAVIDLGHEFSADATIGTLGLTRWSPTALLAGVLGRIWAGDLLAAIITGHPDRVIRPLALYWAPKSMQVRAQALLCANVLYWATEDSEELNELLAAVGEQARRAYI